MKRLKHYNNSNHNNYKNNTTSIQLLSTALQVKKQNQNMRSEVENI